VLLFNLQSYALFSNTQAPAPPKICTVVAVSHFYKGVRYSEKGNDSGATLPALRMQTSAGRQREHLLQPTLQSYPARMFLFLLSSAGEQDDNENEQRPQ
jgi:hypothetical protein